MLRSRNHAGRIGRRRGLPGRSERGSTLISVVVVMLVLTMVGLTLTALVVTTTQSVVSSRDVVQSQQAADAGLADMVATARREGVDCDAVVDSEDPPAYHGEASCEETGEIAFEITGTSGTARTRTRAVYAYTTNVTTGSVTGALVSARLAGGAINISSIYIRNGGDFVIGSGNLDCNNTTIVSGDLFMAHGSVSLSNTCSIVGDLHATGDVTINNNNLIYGSIVTLGTFYVHQGTVAGSVEAVKGVTINSAGVGGDVTSTGSGTSSVYKGTIGGSVKIAGTFSSFQDSTVGGTVLAAGTGSNSIAPTTTIDGNLRLRGTLDTWGSGPTVKGTKTTGSASVTAPTITLPEDLQDAGFSWVDYGYAGGALGTYAPLELTSAQCNFQGNASLTSLIDSLSRPTVVDARACNDVNLYAVPFNLKTDVIFVANKISSAQGLTLTSADGGAHAFSLVVPDNTADGTPTCAAGQGLMKLDDVHMAAEITGLAYSPCEIHLGQSAGVTNVRWNGQVYAGNLTWGGNGGSAEAGMQLYYTAVSLPSLNVEAGPVVSPGEGSLGGLLDRRDI
ncbi:hypothetical protein [Propionicicella superfundia]|uniref:hypothetical protein n=1 Tax=Propionicicella superfundia TaxID=348582 RepID=UPI0004200434|nr:hypothetical protein [Propionicicella superfundia]